MLGRDTNVGYVCFDSDSQIIDQISNVLPVFFFLVAALVCMTTMNRMVEEQRTQIGILKALGYGEGAVTGKYIFMRAAPPYWAVYQAFCGNLAVPQGGLECLWNYV